MDIEEDYWRCSHKEMCPFNLNKTYNDKSEVIIGRRKNTQPTAPQPRSSISIREGPIQHVRGRDRLDQLIMVVEIGGPKRKRVKDST